ncbi:MAG TPA: hypothetical protein VFC24_10790 [Casimicrobiaceae bacterium]|nr:hypothetical protein [Casimicrobiaceae bacterium]
MRERTIIAAIMLAAGAGIIAIALGWIDIAPTPGTPRWVVGLAGSVFAFAGVALLLPPQDSRAQNLIGALLLSAFAAIGLWIGFGPGERHFLASLSGGAAVASSGGHEGLGRFVFGTMGVLVALCALAVWRRVFRA